jgi:hypothetical protein
MEDTQLYRISIGNTKNHSLQSHFISLKIKQHTIYSNNNTVTLIINNETIDITCNKPFNLFGIDNKVLQINIFNKSNLKIGEDLLLVIYLKHDIQVNFYLLTQYYEQ